jgi:hypothetical protein
MENLAFVGVLEKLAPYGVPGIMAFLWWLSIRSLKEAYAAQSKAGKDSAEAQEKANSKILEHYQKVLELYKTDLAGMNGQMSQILKEMSDKYDNNARLVEMFGALTQRYAERGEYLERLIQANIQAMQQCTDIVEKCRQKADR